jgi:hypothetical protein
MPCSSGPSPLERDLDHVTDMLCSLVRMLINDGYEIDAKSRLGIWWCAHEQHDQDQLGIAKVRWPHGQPKK